MESKHPVDADHSAIVKFENETFPAFTQALDCLNDYLRAPRQITVPRDNRQEDVKSEDVKSEDVESSQVNHFTGSFSTSGGKMMIGGTYNSGGGSMSF